MFDKLKGKGLLIHHWDTDGICSAKLLLERLSNKNIINKTPILGNYFLTKEELAEYENFDFVIVADMSLPEENILQLSEKSDVMIFDHHLGKEIGSVFHHNPIIKGENPDKFPSASWIVNDYLKNTVNLFALLGIVGDHEKKIKSNQHFNKIIEGFCEKNNLDFDDLLKMVYLIDSNYKVGMKQSVEKAPRLLLENDSAEFILYNSEWNKNYDLLNKEMQRILSSPKEEINGIIFNKIETKYNIISTITRHIAWDSGKNTVIVNTGFFDDRDQIYVRSKKNAEPLIMRGKELGFKCGGKKEVLGAIVPKHKSDIFVKEIINFLKQ